MFALTPNKKLVNQNTKVQLVHQVLHVWLSHRLYTRFFCLDLQVSIIDLAKIIVWQGGGNGNGAAGWGIGCVWCPHSYWLNSTWSESAPLVMKIIFLKFERNWNSSRCPKGSSKFETPFSIVDERQLFILYWKWWPSFLHLCVFCYVP